MKWLEKKKKKKGISWCCFSKKLFIWMVDFWICGDGGGRVSGGDSGSGSNCSGDGGGGGDGVEESVAVAVAVALVAAIAVVVVDNGDCCLL